MLSLLSPDVIDGLVVVGMFIIRIGLPIGIVLAFGYWLQRRLRPEDFEEAPAIERAPKWMRRVGREMDALPAWLPTIVLMMLVGVGAGIYRLSVGLGTATNLNQGYPWGLWIGFDLFMVAFSGGAFTLAALVYVLGLHKFHAAIRPTVLTGLLGYSSVLLILMMDLGRWDRFYHFIIYPNLNSALFEVSWCILLYTTVLVAEFTPVVLERTHLDRLMNFVKRLPVPLAIIGATLSSLHQSSLGTLFVIMSERVHPLWYTSLLPLLFFISSVASGLAMVVAGGTVSYWVFKRSLPQKLVGDLAKFIPWIMLVYAGIKFGELIYSGDISYLTHRDMYSTLYLVEMLVGVAAPIILFALPQVRSSRAMSFFAAAMLLLGIFVNRFNVAWFSLKPVEGFSYFPSFSEIAIQVGVISAIIFVYTLVGHYFPLFEGLAPTEEIERAKSEAYGLGHAY
ncbi:MAG: NrfD/PsrC family molybdoenzyme membrane anchor subunit [Acidobacteriota bacterium]